MARHDPDRYDREQESPAERIDRNWVELLQELRVSQTGVQILTGFLLTLPLQPAFHELTGLERGAYVVAISASIVATCLIITPVAMHRALFQRRRKETLVRLGHSIAIVGLAFLATAIAGVVTLVFSIIFGGTTGLWVGVAAGLMFVVAWLVAPLSLRERLGVPAEESSDSSHGR
jgi:uncharacterized protein DUF6328